LCQATCPRMDWAQGSMVESLRPLRPYRSSILFSQRKASSNPQAFRGRSNCFERSSQCRQRPSFQQRVPTPVAARAICLRAMPKVERCKSRGKSCMNSATHCQPRMEIARLNMGAPRWPLMMALPAAENSTAGATKVKRTTSLSKNATYSQSVYKSIWNIDHCART